jgi:hypothetical protein
MNMQILEERFRIPTTSAHAGLLTYFSQFLDASLVAGVHPVRFVITETDTDHYHCEVGVLSGGGAAMLSSKDSSIFAVRRRALQHETEFNAVLLIPTGIGAEIGGHAGDSTPVARLMAGVCDNLILHPNVVNASDVNEMPTNSLYVEGSVITRMLMGTVGIKKVRSNRILLVVDAHEIEEFVSAAINSGNAARATCGWNISKVVKMDPPVALRATYSDSGRATGTILGLERLLAVIEENRAEIDAVAISSVVQLPAHYHLDYFRCEGDMLNPWGGVEALLTHALSTLTGLPTAHSPMFESEAVSNLKSGIVDSRMAAEAVSFTFLQCVLKGLHASPKVVANAEPGRTPGLMTVEDISCLVIPDGCLGIPTLAALEQGIPVIAVQENKNIMKNDLTVLPWRRGQFFRVNTYLEAIGVMMALREGIAVDSLRRPILGAPVEQRNFSVPGFAARPPTSLPNALTLRRRSGDPSQ